MLPFEDPLPIASIQVTRKLSDIGWHLHIKIQGTPDWANWLRLHKTGITEGDDIDLVVTLQTHRNSPGWLREDGTLHIQGIVLHRVYYTKKGEKPLYGKITSFALHAYCTNVYRVYMLS